MRKMFKAAASLAVGCAMLSTSAFAALTGTPALSDDRSAVNVTVSGVGADKESTILVLKGALTEMPATINDDDIVYIYQKTAAADGTATYSMPLGTRVGDATAVTVFAGATDEATAARLGSVTLASEPVEVDPTGIAIHKDGAAVTKALDMNEKAAAIQLTAVVAPENATGTVAWTSTNEGAATVKDGLVTPVAPGKTTIKATIGKVEASVDLVVWRYGDVDGNGETDEYDALEILNYVSFMDSCFDDGAAWREKAGAILNSEAGTTDEYDALEILYYVSFMPSALDTLIP